MDRYVNFDLVIDRLDDGYEARVIDSPAGEASSTFSFPFSKLEVENFLLRVGQSRRSVRRIDSPEMEAARQFGGTLYDTVFNGEVRTCFRRALDEADRENLGLRLRVRFDDALEMSDLPWEYLYSSGLGRFLVLSTQTPLVRYIDLPTRIRPLEVSPPLRILVMVSSPTDYVELNVDDEYRKLEESLDDLVRAGKVELDRLDEASLSKLQQRLRQGEYHIFHFVGHGGFDESRDDGVLMLEDEQGRGRAVSGHEVATLLHDHRSLRLAVLNSCEGARNSVTDPFAGTAQTLVQQGIPAVIAMQFEISDEAAIVFAHEFYAAVADGYPVDAAMAEARKAVYTDNPSVEWGTPVLNMRSPDGMVFDVQGEAVPLPEAEAPRADQRIEGTDVDRSDSSAPAQQREQQPEQEPEPEPQQQPEHEPEGIGVGDVIRSHEPPPLVTTPPAAAAALVTLPSGPSDRPAEQPFDQPAERPGTPAKRIPTWVWVVVGVFGTLFILGVIGSLIPDPDEAASDATRQTFADITEPEPGDVLPLEDETPSSDPAGETPVFRPGPEVRPEPVFDFDQNGWPIWDAASAALVATPHVVFSDEWDGSADLDTQWRFGWDEEFLYAEATVFDDVHFQDQVGNTVYLGDSLNLDFDTDLAGDAEVGRPNGDDFQLLVSVGSDIVPASITLFEGNGSIFVDTPFLTATEMAVFDLSTADEFVYLVDLAIPWSDLGVVPEPGTRLGFRVSANDNDLGFPIQEVMYTNAAESSLFDVRTWGTLILE